MIPKKANHAVNASSTVISFSYDYFFDVINCTRGKGCENINSSDHRHVFGLLNYVRFHHLWGSQVRTEWDFNIYFSGPTYEDICWTAIGIVAIARLQLPTNTAMIQQHHGSDHLKEQFCGIRNMPRPKTQIWLLLVRDQKLWSPLLEAVKPMVMASWVNKREKDWLYKEF